MIKFHKINGKPKNVPKGEENVWYSYPEGLYVADINGVPRLIAPGRQVGSTTPVGTPSEPGLFYYNSQTRKHYISDDQGWQELGVGRIPGSGGGDNTAGNILIDDSAGNYTAIDIEGALAEIAEKFPWYFNKNQLQDYTNAKSGLTQSTEKYITNQASGFANPGWLTQRKASNGNLYSLLIGEDGVHVQAGNKMMELATKDELGSLGEAVSKDLNKTIQDELKKLKITPGEYISVSGNSIPSGQKIGLSPDFIEEFKLLKKSVFGLENKPDDTGTFVRNTGDTITGIIKMKPDATKSDSSYSETQYYDSKGKLAGSIWCEDARFGLWDYKTNDMIVGTYASSQKTIVRATKELELWSRENNVSIWPDGTNSAGGGTKKGSEILMYPKNEKGQRACLAVRSTTGIPGYTTPDIVLEASNGVRTSAGALRIRGMHDSVLHSIELKADNIYTYGRIATGMGLGIGYDPYTNKPYWNNRDAKLWLYAVEGRAKSERYAEIFFSGDQNTVLFNKHIKTPGVVQTSSEKFKENIEEYKENVLGIIRNTKTYQYNFKNDEAKNRQLGLIIERGVPEVLLADHSNREGIDTYSLATFLWKAVQELTEEVDNLKTKLKED